MYGLLAYILNWMTRPKDLPDEDNLRRGQHRVQYADDNKYNAEDDA